MPIIALFLLMLSDQYTLIGKPQALVSTSEAYSPWAEAQSRLFIMALASVLLGLFGASNELVRERSIFRRERMVNLKLIPYLLSKLAVLGVFAGIQCALLVVVLGTRIQFPDSGLILSGTFDIYLTLFLACLASIALGLLISSLSNSLNMVTYVVMILLFVQIIFSGAIFKVQGAVQGLSYLTVTRWTLDGLGSIDRLGRLGEDTQACVGGAAGCQKVSVSVNDMALPYDSAAGHLFFVWLVLIGLTAACMWLTFKVIQLTERDSDREGIVALMARLHST
jgi:ABC-type multidrug transport system permease subunit